MPDQYNVQVQRKAPHVQDQYGNQEEPEIKTVESCAGNQKAEPEPFDQQPEGGGAEEMEKGSYRETTVGNINGTHVFTRILDMEGLLWMWPWQLAIVLYGKYSMK